MERPAIWAPSPGPSARTSTSATGTCGSAFCASALAAGPHATDDEDERARRQDRLQWASAAWDALPFGTDAARAYARVFAASRVAGRPARRRLADLMVASVAVANALPLYTRNVDDFEHLDALVSVVGV